MNHTRYGLKTYFAVLLVLLAAPQPARAEDLKPETIKAWNRYIQFTEARIADELDGQRGFLVRDFKSGADPSTSRNLLKLGQVQIEEMQTKDDKKKEIAVDDGKIHHWNGSIFIPNMTVARLLTWIQDYDQHHRYFMEVEKSRLVSRQGDTFRMFLRLVRTKFITVHYNTEHTVTFRQHDTSRTSSKSVSTRIAEIVDPGTPGEKEMPVGKDQGYFWRTNSYWRYRQEDSGVFVECESISLSRGIPWGIGWIPGLKGILESIPQESLESMLTSIRDGATSAGKTP